jgi:transposase
LERRRCYPVKLLKQRYQPIEIARQLGVDRRSIPRWKAAFLKEDPSTFQAQSIPGRPSKLSPSEKKQLEQELLNGAKMAGFLTNLWTCPRVAQLIQKRFRIRYHVDHIRRLLHELGWSPQKPQRRAPERDKDKKVIQTWIKQECPRIKKASRLKAFLVFIDESGLLMAPLVRRSWAPCGYTPILYQRTQSH